VPARVIRAPLRSAQKMAHWHRHGFRWPGPQPVVNHLACQSCETVTSERTRANLEPAVREWPDSGRHCPLLSDSRTHCRPVIVKKIGCHREPSRSGKAVLPGRQIVACRTTFIVIARNRHPACFHQRNNLRSDIHHAGFQTIYRWCFAWYLQRNIHM
jgi:hypothetical protein